MRACLIIAAITTFSLLTGCSQAPQRREPAPVVSGTAVRDQPTVRQPEAGAPPPPAAPAAPTTPRPLLPPMAKSVPVQPPRIQAMDATPPMRPPTSYEPASITPMPFVEAPAPLADTNLQPGRFEPPTPTAPETQGIGIGTRTVTDDPGTTLQRYESTAPSPPSPAHSRAATTLLAIAEREEAQGKFGLAAQQVERAIDLEPRNADLWHHLAKLRLTEGRLEAAVEAAQTSNRLAGGNLELRRNNWGLISEVRFEQGDTTAAEQARRMVEELY